MTWTKRIVWIPEGARGKDHVNDDRDLRTKAIHTCGICGTRTNRWAVAYMWGNPSLHLYCPYRNDIGGNEINERHRRLGAFQDRLYDDKALTKREIIEIRTEIGALLDYFQTLKDDVITCKE